MKLTLSTLLISLSLSAPAMAQQAANDHPAHRPAGASTATAVADLADAEVRRVDKDAAKVTLKHGEIKSLDMPPMTMVFNVKDKAMLDGVKAGDKVRFRVVNDAGRYTVTELQVVR